MAVISRERIFKLLNKPVADQDPLVISPLLQARKAFDADSVDLRLGTHFLLPRVPPRPYFYPGVEASRLGHQRLHVPFGRYLVVPAHETVLGVTLEFIKLPSDVSGQILTKSSVARMFVVIETAPWIHPGYRGCLTLEIANVSNTPLLLYPGRLVAQLVLFDTPDAKPPAKQSGTCMGPIYPEAPKFKDPEQELALLGVEQIDNPAKPATNANKQRCPDCFSPAKTGVAECLGCGRRFQ